MFGSVARDVERAKRDWFVHRDRRALMYWFKTSKADHQTKLHMAAGALLEDKEWAAILSIQLEQWIEENPLVFLDDKRMVYGHLVGALVLIYYHTWRRDGTDKFLQENIHFPRICAKAMEINSDGSGH